MPGRMFVEGDIAYGESPRMAAQRLMRSLDEAAAKDGHRVSGQVRIEQFEASGFGVSSLRLEADVEAAV